MEKQYKPIEPPHNILPILFICSVIFLAYIIFYSVVGVNNPEEITVIQSPFRSYEVILEPRTYITFFGKTTVYKKINTFKFTEPIMFADAKTATLQGTATFTLEKVGESTMVRLHVAYGDQEILKERLFKHLIRYSITLVSTSFLSKEIIGKKSRDKLTLALMEKAKKSTIGNYIQSITITSVE